MPNKSHYFPAILIAGIIGGIFSGSPLLNCCCFFWAPLAAILAVKLVSNKAQYPIEAFEGMLIGLYTGLIAAFIGFIVIMFTMNINGDFTFQGQMSPDMQEKLKTFNDQIDPKLAAKLIVGFMSSITIIFTSLLGGLLGVSFFSKR